MVLLSDVIDTQELDQLVSDGYVTLRHHDSLPLSIANYTAKTQYEWKWTSTTEACRGLVFNHETMEIVARPFSKFHNWDQSGSPFPPSGPCLRMEKMDGSLGVLVTMDYDNGTPTRELIATRGSFHSDQAKWATDFYLRYLYEISNSSQREAVFCPLEGKTYLFEIIFPENRIVVGYGDYEGLVLIDVIDNRTGFPDTDEFDNCQWPDKVVRRPLPGFDSGQAVDIPEGDEGFVYLWPVRNFRTKMKSARYVEIHRMVFGLTSKKIWEHLCNGGTLDDLKRDLPEEFHEFVDREGLSIIRNAAEIMETAQIAYSRLNQAVLNENGTTRKDAATWIQKNYPRLSQYLFSLLDNRPIRPLALKASKPTSEKSAVNSD